MSSDFKLGDDEGDGGDQEGKSDGDEGDDGDSSDEDDKWEDYSKKIIFYFMDVKY